MTTMELTQAGKAHVKNEIASGALAETLAKYRGMPIARRRRALVIGSDRNTNIGAAIAETLRVTHNLDETAFEVAEPPFHDLNVGYANDLATYDMSDFDVLVLANGYTDLDWIEDQDPVEIIKIVHNNLLGSMLATREYVRQTINIPYRKFIVYIGSMAYRSVLNASAYYCAAKAGLAQFAKCAGWELTPKGYRVFCVHPSNTEGTPMTEKTINGIQNYRGISHEEAEAYWGAINLMPNWLDAASIGEVVRWLVTERAAEFLSGSDIELKAGQR